MKNKEKIALLLERVERLERSVFNVFDTKEESIDKFAELKEAHRNGAVIEVKSYLDGKWHETNNPSWLDNHEYRIKPEDKPKVGDVCKLWNYDERHFEISKLVRIYKESQPYKYASSASSWINAKPITKEEAIKLLFNDEETN